MPEKELVVKTLFKRHEPESLPCLPYLKDLLYIYFEVTMRISMSVFNTLYYQVVEFGHTCILALL